MHSPANPMLPNAFPIPKSIRAHEASRIILELDYLMLNKMPPRQQTDLNGIVDRCNARDFLILPPENSRGRCLDVCVHMYSHVRRAASAEIDGSHMLLTVETSKLDIHPSTLLNPLQTLFTSADGERLFCIGQCVI